MKHNIIDENFALFVEKAYQKCEPFRLIEMEALMHQMVIGDNPDGALPTTILRNEKFDVSS